MLQPSLEKVCHKTTPVDRDVVLVALSTTCQRTPLTVLSLWDQPLHYPDHPLSFASFLYLDYYNISWVQSCFFCLTVEVVLLPKSLQILYTPSCPQHVLTLLQVFCTFPQANILMIGSTWLWLWQLTGLSEQHNVGSEYRHCHLLHSPVACCLG